MYEDLNYDRKEVTMYILYYKGLDYFFDTLFRWSHHKIINYFFSRFGEI